MGKKGKTYILLAVVLGIWGTIGYQIYSKLNTDEKPVEAVHTVVSFSPKEHLEKDTFSIGSNHYDPFLNKPYHKKTASIKTGKLSNNKSTIVFPKIIYKGVISKQKSSQNIYILDINGRQQLFKIGKEIDSIRLIRGSKKSVFIAYKGKRKEIGIE